MPSFDKREWRTVIAGLKATVVAARAQYYNQVISYDRAKRQVQKARDLNDRICEFHPDLQEDDFVWHL